MRQRTDTKPWYKQFWPWFLIALPGSTVLASIYMVSLAVRTADSMVEGDYYKEGLAINESLAEERLARELAVEVDLQFQDSRLSLETRSAAGEPRAELVLFQHPLDDELDFTLTVNDALLSLPSGANVAGRWYLEVQGSSDQGAWKLKGDHDFRNSATAKLRP